MILYLNTKRMEIFLLETAIYLVIFNQQKLNYKNMESALADPENLFFGRGAKIFPGPNKSVLLKLRELNKGKFFGHYYAFLRGA